MGNVGIRESQLVGDALNSIAGLLPASWRTATGAPASPDSDRRDASLELTGPDGASVSFVVEAKRSGSLSVPLVLAVLRDRVQGSGLPVLFVSDYIGPALRDALREEGVSFADATGWVWVMSEDPLILLTGQGAERAPRSIARSGVVTRLNGVAASRIIRALSVAELPVGVRALAVVADVSPGSVAKLLPTLAAEGIVDRDEVGAVAAVRRRALIRRWVSDYSFAQANQSVRHCIAPRGLDRTLTRLAGGPVVALTGSAAARRILPAAATSVVPMWILAMYTADPAALIGELALVDADQATANVVIARPQDTNILPAGGPDTEVGLAPVALVLADLLTLPGRSDSEAEQLMDALASNDPAWRDGDDRPGPGVRCRATDTARCVDCARRCIAERPSVIIRRGPGGTREKPSVACNRSWVLTRLIEQRKEANAHGLR